MRVFHRVRDLGGTTLVDERGEAMQARSRSSSTDKLEMQVPVGCARFPGRGGSPLRRRRCCDGARVAAGLGRIEEWLCWRW